ncbi:uncharacterized protein LOC120842790, partial [Ixodes scapularis]|uniref:uncharacterized protein LOC120842790 n=1 Tax=Ixodes scapularis TaxID=6945 RepID=UPI001A9FBDF1
HVEIPGNDEVDRAAGTSGTRAVDISCIPYRDYCAQWQSEWSLKVSNKLHMITPFLSKWQSARHRDRFYEVVLCRLRIAHTRLTHGHLLRGEDPPECGHCQEPLSVLHILLEYPAYDEKNLHYFSQLYKEHVPLHLCVLLGNEPLLPSTQVCKFLKSVDFLHKL